LRKASNYSLRDISICCFQDLVLTEVGISYSDADEFMEYHVRDKFVFNYDTGGGRRGGRFGARMSVF
jgi:hypothetical protein